MQQPPPRAKMPMQRVRMGPHVRGILPHCGPERWLQRHLLMKEGTRTIHSRSSVGTSRWLYV